MGLAKKKAVVMLMIMIMMIKDVCGGGVVYKVGDSAGWTNNGHFDYKTWSSSKNFLAGDTIVFEYNKQLQNVVRVTHKNFNACNATAAYLRFNSGNDSFTITRGGHFYFICSLPGHCQAGQKVDIRVPRTPPSPTPPPTSSPFSSSPSPLPLPLPVPSPVPSSSPSPSPSSLPVPSPAPHSPPSLSPVPSPSSSPVPSLVPLSSPSPSSLPVPSPAPPSPPSLSPVPSPVPSPSPSSDPHKSASSLPLPMGFKSSSQLWLFMVVLALPIYGFAYY